MSEVPGNITHSKNNETINTFVGILSELLFVLLPLLVLAFVSVHKGDTLWQFISAREISFAAAILFGQTVVKFVSGISVSGENIWERIALVVSLLIVLGLVPSMIILALIMTSNNPGSWLVWTQLFFFLLSVCIFFVLGGVGHIALKRGSSVQK